MLNLLAVLFFLLSTGAFTVLYLKVAFSRTVCYRSAAALLVAGSAFFALCMFVIDAPPVTTLTWPGRLLFATAGGVSFAIVMAVLLWTSRKWSGFLNQTETWRRIIEERFPGFLWP